VCDGWREWGGLVLAIDSQAFSTLGGKEGNVKRGKKRKNSLKLADSKTRTRNEERSSNLRKKGMKERERGRSVHRSGRGYASLYF